MDTKITFLRTCHIINLNRFFKRSFLLSPHIPIWNVKLNAFLFYSNCWLKKIKMWSRCGHFEQDWVSIKSFQAARCPLYCADTQICITMQACSAYTYLLRVTSAYYNIINIRINEWITTLELYIHFYRKDQFIYAYGFGFFGDYNSHPNTDIPDGWMHQTEKKRERKFTRCSKKNQRNGTYTQDQNCWRF